MWLGSRVLSSVESNYSNIEREALAIVEAMKYFHKFIAGRLVTIISNHRPLQFIFAPPPNKFNDRVSARLQRWAITLRNYEIQYVSGKKCMAQILFRVYHF